MAKFTAVKLARGRFDHLCDQFEKAISPDIMRAFCEAFQDLDNAWLEAYKEAKPAPEGFMCSTKDSA